MTSEEKKYRKQGLIIAIIVLIFPALIAILINNFGGYDIDDVRAKMEEHLYEKYGEEFVVDRIGTRTSRDREFYQARIYPKSIVGSGRQNDEYFHATASITKETFGGLGGVGDSYGLTMINIGAEEFLIPKAKEIFGERVKLKSEVKYRIKNSHGFYEWNREPNFLKALQNVKDNSDTYRIELTLYVYIFERIESEEEKQLRKEEIFEFVQYLKEEGLYEYLELGVIFIDERVLAPSYSDFTWELRFADRESVEIGENTVSLPSMELREKISKELQEEIEQMSEEELLASMREIRKSDLSYRGIRKDNSQYQSRIYSTGMLEEYYRTSLERNPALAKKYNDLSDIVITRNLEYIYLY